MRLITPLFAIMLFTLCLPLSAQVASFDEMDFESDSVKTTYKPSGKNYVLVRSKRGNSGVNKTLQADAIVNAEINEIVLVFTELEASELAEREKANRERWENLLKTYPELFQFSTSYKNVCQCNTNGDGEAFKHAQGFYIYVNGEVPKAAEEPAAASSPPAAKPEETPAPAKPAKEEKVLQEKEVAVADRTAVKPKEAPPVEKPVSQKEPETVAAEPVAEEAPAAEPVKETPRKKTAAASNKPRRAKDAKACRPPCYGYGDEDLHTFFKDHITLNKKQKRKAKSWVANVRIQINFDGSIKKTMVTGTNEDFNKIVEDVLKAMNNWNSAVKSGVAVKSEVRFNLKYDSQTKSMKPADMIINPRPSPKCPCISDSEMFGED